ncbi:MAG TPA: alginate export family protein [Terriglobales bacterium]|nr:alginate export family protein [Terriglobales bacterium]
MAISVSYCRNRRIAAPSTLRLAVKLFFFVVTLLLLIAHQAAAQAAGATPAAPDPQSNKAQRNGDLNLRFGFEQRTRWENWNNIIDFNDAHPDQRNQIRFRNRFWLGLPVSSDVEFFVGLGNEFRVETTPDVPIQGNEMIFESLYLDFRNLFTPRLSLRVGRQDIFRGEGFILADGTSGDGSRTGYFNALDLSCKFRKSELEVIGILDPRQDRFLPRVNDQRMYLTEWDEQAAGLYYTHKNLANTKFEGYYFLKKEINDHRSRQDPQFRPNRTFNTLGGRIVRRLADGWTGTAELAEQWGSQHPETRIRAWGGYATVKKEFKARLKPYFLMGYWALSGDDPRTANRVEGWDPLFSRWPKWGGDLTLYSYIPESGVGYASNDRFSQLESGISPNKFVSLRGTWYHHDAFHPMSAGPQIFGPGTYRGELLQLRGDLVLNSNVKGHILYERYLPGNFYLRESPGHFFRMEISYSFNGTIPLRGLIE